MSALSMGTIIKKKSNGMEFVVIEARAKDVLVKCTEHNEEFRLSYASINGLFEVIF